MKNNLFLLILSASFLGNGAHAGTMGEEQSDSLLHQFFVTVSGGPSWPSNTNNQSFIVGASKYSYRTPSQGTNGMGGVSLGKEYLLPMQAKAQLSIAYYGFGNFSQSGRVEQGTEPQDANTFPYHYHFSSQQLVVEGKVLGTYYNILHPYAQVGLGVAFNNARGYEVNVPDFITFSPQFTDHQQSAFTYNLGLGLEMDVNTHWRAGLGYRFSDLGKISFGQGRIDDVFIANTLHQSNFYTNTLLAQVTYII